jgi:hypothetical protein
VLGLEDNAISDWPEVLRLAGLPQLRRLHLSGNPISNIAYPAHNIPLSALLAQQPPAAASADQPQQQQQPAEHLQQQQQAPFAVLEALLLGNCQISSWADVDALNQLPRLAELRLSGNPLFAAEAGAAGGGRRYEVTTCSCSTTSHQQCGAVHTMHGMLPSTLGSCFLFVHLVAHTQFTVLLHF